GLPRHPAGPQPHRQAREDRSALRALDGARHAVDPARNRVRRQGRARVPGGGDERLRDDRQGGRGDPPRHRRGDGHDGREQGGRLRLPLGRPLRRRRRGPRRRRQLDQGRARHRRLRRPRPRGRLQVRRERPAAVLHLQRQARVLVPVRPRPGAAAAQHRARAPDQGAARQRAALRARARALVPALGRPAL
ncbi:MAG: hypothetical protein AVDCRST_MAG85-2529, partial [uncultured Solirubrobacteraceae bacterium]